MPKYVIAMSLGKYPHMCNVVKRTESFVGFIRSYMNVEQMAASGLFYIGIEDFVYCYHCGVGLGEWIEGDDPWIEHAFYSPSCYYLTLVKGTNFIAKALLRRTLNVTELGTLRRSKSESNLIPCTIIEEHETCIICLSARRDVVFLLCGHLVVCAMRSTGIKKCPVCRQKKEGVIKVYQ